jgi:predicted RNA polymerase sigma factor
LSAVAVSMAAGPTAGLALVDELVARGVEQVVVVELAARLEECRA